MARREAFVALFLATVLLLGRATNAYYYQYQSYRATLVLARYPELVGVRHIHSPESLVACHALAAPGFNITSVETPVVVGDGVCVRMRFSTCMERDACLCLFTHTRARSHMVFTHKNGQTPYQTAQFEVRRLNERAHELRVQVDRYGPDACFDRNVCQKDVAKIELEMRWSRSMDEEEVGLVAYRRIVLASHHRRSRK
jgi:hypothetical protein